MASNSDKALNSALGQTEKEAIALALKASGYDLQKPPLGGSSDYAWSFRATKDGKNFCIKTLATLQLDCHENAQCSTTLPADTDRITDEIANMRLGMERRIPDDVHEFARIVGQPGTWTSPIARKQINWYAQDWIDGKELAEYFSAYETFAGCSNAKDWCYWSKKVMELIARLHHYGIAHGDLWPRNIKVRLDADASLALIDFADSMDIASSHGQSQDSPTTQKGEKARWQAPEEPGKHAWFQTDIWRMGRILLWLAIGKSVNQNVLPSLKAQPNGQKTEVQVIQNSNTQATNPSTNENVPLCDNEDSDSQRRKLKSDIQKALRDYNPKLLQEVPWIVDILLLCLHRDLPHRAASVGDVLTLMETFQRASDDNAKHSQIGELIDYCKKLQRHLVCTNSTPKPLPPAHKKKNAFEENPFFINMLKLELGGLERRVSDTNETRIYQITGSRDECIHRLIDFMSFLNKGDTYIATTIPAFWTSHGLGTDGRFLRMNLQLARTGVNIKRIFLVAENGGREAFRAKDNAFKKHQHLICHLKKYFAGCITIDDDLNQPGCYFGDAEIDPTKLERYKNYGLHVGLAVQSGVCTSVYCRPTDDHLTQVTFKLETDGKVLKRMQEQFKKSGIIEADNLDIIEDLSV